MRHTPPTPGQARLRRTRTDIREALLESALVEFGAKGFDGASTRAIARAVEAHQPQINYHFESKAALWTAAVDYLFALLGEALAGVCCPQSQPGLMCRGSPPPSPTRYAGSCTSPPSTLNSTRSWCTRARRPAIGSRG